MRMAGISLLALVAIVGVMVLGSGTAQATHGCGSAIVVAPNGGHGQINKVTHMTCRKARRVLRGYLNGIMDSRGFSCTGGGGIPGSCSKGVRRFTFVSD